MHQPCRDRLPFRVTTSRLTLCLTLLAILGKAITAGTYFAFKMVCWLLCFTCFFLLFFLSGLSSEAHAFFARKGVAEK